MGCNICKGENEYENEIYTSESAEISGKSPKKSKTKRKDILLKSKSPNKLNSDLKKLLTIKFSLIDQNIEFNEISTEAFKEILNKNPYYERVINNLKEEIEDFLFENNTKYDNIIPIKIQTSSGDLQYYQGSYNWEGKCHGPGIWCKNNNIYLGNFSNDEFCGKGIFIDPKGNYYFGDWNHNKCNGQGKLVIDEIEAYQGDFKDNKKSGEGIEHFDNMDVYFGHYYNGVKNGNGKYIFSDGTAYEGTFNNSKIDGNGKIKFNDGKKYVGEFKNGQITGNGELFYENKVKFKGEFLVNKKNGNGEYIWSDGKNFKGNWKNDILEKGIFEDKENKIVEKINNKNGKMSN